MTSFSWVLCFVTLKPEVAVSSVFPISHRFWPVSFRLTTPGRLSAGCVRSVPRSLLSSPCVCIFTALPAPAPPPSSPWPGYMTGEPTSPNMCMWRCVCVLSQAFVGHKKQPHWESDRGLTFQSGPAQKPCLWMLYYSGVCKENTEFVQYIHIYKKEKSTGECRHKAIIMHHRTIHESGRRCSSLKRFKVFNLKHMASCGWLRQL